MKRGIVKNGEPIWDGWLKIIIQLSALPPPPPFLVRSHKTVKRNHKGEDMEFQESTPAILLCVILISVCVFFIYLRACLQMETIFHAFELTRNEF
jgi:hypothetical protein